MQLKVIKADGAVEEYLHTKVIATLIKVVNSTNQADSYAAEQLADAVTFYLYNDYDREQIASGQILSVITAALETAGFSRAAISLVENHHYRNLLRSRIAVVEAELDTVAQAEEFIDYQQNAICCLWNKSIIVDGLVRKHNFCNSSARVAASMVEEKVLKMDLRRVPRSFIKHLVLTTAAAVRKAENELLPAADNRGKAKELKTKQADKDVVLRQGNGVYAGQV